MPLRLCFPRHRYSCVLFIWCVTQSLLCHGNNASKFVLISRQFMLLRPNQRRSLISNSLRKSGTSNIRRSPSLGAVIGRILSPSLLSLLRFAGQFILPMPLSRWIAVCGRWLNLNRFFPLLRLLSSWFIWRCGISPRSGQCRFAIGNLHLIALPSSSRIVSTASS